MVLITLSTAAATLSPIVSTAAATLYPIVSPIPSSILLIACSIWDTVANWLETKIREFLNFSSILTRH